MTPGNAEKIIKKSDPEEAEEKLAKKRADPKERVDQGQAQKIGQLQVKGRDRSVWK